MLPDSFFKYPVKSKDDAVKAFIAELKMILDKPQEKIEEELGLVVYKEDLIKGRGDFLA
jgi:hypothetical protein